MTIAERRAAGVETNASPAHVALYPTSATSDPPAFRWSPSAPGYARTNAFAITSMVLGIVGGSILAIIFGHLAKVQIRRTGEHGGGMATAGLVLGYLGTALVAVVIISSWVAAASIRRY